MMTDVIVVGSGIFGMIAASTLRREGASVTVIGDGRSDAGSKPAGCVLQPSWMTNMSRADIDAALLLLDELYGLDDVEFELRPTCMKLIKCWRVEPSKILQPSEIHDTAVRLTEETVITDNGEYSAPKIVLACGVWAQQLAPWVGGVTGKFGWSHRAPPVKSPFIAPWAPYRQTVGFNMIDGRSWLGDGQALIERSATEERQEQSRHRCMNAAFSQPQPMDTLRGARPYAVETSGQPCLVRRSGNIWAVTGGGKNGTAAAAWAAQKLAREVLQ